MVRIYYLHNLLTCLQSLFSSPLSRSIHFLIFPLECPGCLSLHVLLYIPSLCSLRSLKRAPWNFCSVMHRLPYILNISQYAFSSCLNSTPAMPSHPSVARLLILILHVYSRRETYRWCHYDFTVLLPTNTPPLS